MKPSTIVLKPGKEMALHRFHPWVFSGAIEQIDSGIAEGDMVTVLGSRKEFLGIGHYLGGSLAIKIFSFRQMDINDDFWFSKLRDAYETRKSLGLLNGNVSNAHRLIFSEGDGMPGLIIDYYNGVAVIQTHTLGMHRLIPMFGELLQRLYGSELKAVYNKSAETMGRIQNSGMGQRNMGSQGKKELMDDQFIFGNSGPVEILETGHRFMVDFVRGQKTGFFLDQRGNRMFSQFYAKDRSVLNACCYSGAFSVYAMKGGATAVHSVDSSKAAIGWTEENLLLNGCDTAGHRAIVADVKKYLAETPETYDMIILDPPAFAKSHLVSNNALHAYIHINAEALKRLNPGGILFTFSCSQPISREMFRSAVQSAAIETKKEVRIIHQLTQGPDHPVNVCHPEGEYLKGFILVVQ